MCFNPVKALPYAAGGLLGGPILQSVFGGKKKPTTTGAVTTAGTPGPGPSPSNISGGG